MKKTIPICHLLVAILFVSEILIGVNCCDSKDKGDKLEEKLQPPKPADRPVPTSPVSKLPDTNKPLPEKPLPDSPDEPLPTTEKSSNSAPKYPDTKRVGKEIEEYKVLKLNEWETEGNKRSKRTKYQKDEYLEFTGEVCARGLGDLYLVKLDKTKTVSPKNTVYEICYDSGSETVVYTFHKIELFNKGTMEKSNHTNFAEPYSLFNWKPKSVNDLYSINSQVEEFSKIFTDKQTYVVKTPKVDSKDRKNEYDKQDVDRYYARCHLTPHADFATVAEQERTYYCQNIYAGIQSTNKGHWKSIEEHTRKLGDETKSVLDIYTGIHGKLELPLLNNKKKKVELFLDNTNKKIRIPEYAWKLIIDQKKKKAVAFFMSNNVVMQQEDIDELEGMCTNVCPDIGFDEDFDFEDDGEKQLKLNRAGRVICCSYADFVRHIQYLPNYGTFPTNAPLVTSEGQLGRYKVKRTTIDRKVAKRSASPEAAAPTSPRGKAK